MRGLVAWVLGIGLAANGLIMLAAPADWYAMVPGVAGTGPFNAHFVRDIGAAYLVAGATLPWFAVNRAARPAALAGAAFLASARAGASLGRRGRAGTRASASHRPACRVPAAGAGDLDRLAAAQPQRGETR